VAGLNGKASLRLEDIGPPTAFSPASPDALSDVEAALRLARLLARNGNVAPPRRRLPQGSTPGGRKLPVAFKTAAGDHKWGVLVSSEFGTRQRLRPVIALGYSAPTQSVLWLLDRPHLGARDGPTVAETTWVSRKRFGEPGFLLPPTDRTLESIGRERRQHMQENLRWLESHEAEFQQISAYHATSAAFIPDLDADASLYQTGFLPRADEALCRAFTRSV
jgi:exodeoxyribonuclease-1